MMNEPLYNALNWFDIPVTDLDRATRFYSEILGVTLERYSAPGIEGALFLVQDLGGALLKGEGFIPSHQGSTVYFNGGTNLQQVSSGLIRNQ